MLIEAKSINKGTSVYDTNKQIENYIDQDIFEELIPFKCYGITLTKFPSYTNHQYLTSITWEDIIRAFYNAKKSPNSLLDDYFNFLTNINGTMKFYEKEVFSIPMAKWSEKAVNDFNLYECPNSGKHIIKQKPLYITFRKSGGGEMDKLFKIEDIIILNFRNDYSTFLNDTNYSEDKRNRVEGYVKYMLDSKKWLDLPNDEKQVFIFSNNTIELIKKPKPKNGNNSFRAYYDLIDLFNNSSV